MTMHLVIDNSTIGIELSYCGLADDFDNRDSWTYDRVRFLKSDDSCDRCYNALLENERWAKAREESKTVEKSVTTVHLDWDGVIACGKDHSEISAHYIKDQVKNFLDCETAFENECMTFEQCRDCFVTLCNTYALVALEADADGTRKWTVTPRSVVKEEIKKGNEEETVAEEDTVTLTVSRATAKALAVVARPIVAADVGYMRVNSAGATALAEVAREAARAAHDVMPHETWRGIHTGLQYTIYGVTDELVWFGTTPEQWYVVDKKSFYRKYEYVERQGK
jgi:hypothetical protein